MYATVLLSLISLKTFLLGISNKNLNISQMSPYLIRIEGPPPKRQFVRIRLEPKIEYFLYKSQ